MPPPQRNPAPSPAVPAPLSSTISPEERARLVVALDHDVRQPQHSVDMGLRTLRLTVADLQQRRFNDQAFDAMLESMMIEIASIQAAHRQVGDAHRDLIETILIDSDQRPVRPRVVRANDLIDRICRSCRPIATGMDLRGIRSRLTFFSDERYLERVLTNLLSNAIRHSNATKIAVCARRSGGDVVFEIRDNGRGITSNYVLDVFGAGPPVPPTIASPAAVASGLGLYIVRVFVDKLGGSIRCRSERGRGTRFEVRLPGPLGTVDSVHRTTSADAAKAARHKFVAVLDDDVEVLRTVQRHFESLGIEVYADHDPLRWLSAVTDLGRLPDLFLLDFQLKHQDCSLQLDIVQRKWGKAAARVLVLSDRTPNPRLSKLAESVPVLQKPLTPASLDYLLEVLAGISPLPSAGLVTLPRA